MVTRYAAYRQIGKTHQQTANLLGIKTEMVEFNIKPDTFKCSICGEQSTGHENNAWPVNDGKCCDDCNFMKVIPARLAAQRRLKQ